MSPYEKQYMSYDNSYGLLFKIPWVPMNICLWVPMETVIGSYVNSYVFLWRCRWVPKKNPMGSY